MLGVLWCGISKVRASIRTGSIVREVPSSPLDTKEGAANNNNNNLYLPSNITNTNTIINNISKYLEGTGT